ncbi:hypothetical protein B0I35DRAFT_476927 [Stachybotrys elegans]|uniref:ATP-grasp domain-containing protein n=1 Tax=Stachybotrys elegans TaxID=80388 RepID=A0A8K0SW65_9HYPO|nr:hypothetical protein B0I35DRAFT_476927 [Stachybotrys elegans]
MDPAIVGQGQQLARLSPIAASRDRPAYATLDCVLTLLDQESPDGEAPGPGLDLAGGNDRPALNLLRDAFAMLSGTSSVLVRFVFSRHEGYVIRCDFLERRLEGCIFSQRVKSFLSPLQYVAAVPDLAAGNILDILAKAVGGILSTCPGPDKRHGLLTQLDEEMTRRLSFPWTLSEPIPRRRIVWVQGRDNFESIHRAYEAAWALGLTLVIVDQPGHWLEDDNGPYAHLREAFIPTSIAVDAGFAQRIVDVVKNHPHKVDGLVTISDGRLPGIAKASEILGLSTEPSDSYLKALDKGTTRMLERKVPGDFTTVVTSVSELDEIVAKHEGDLPFPLIAKPCLGWNSDCVAKVKNLEELRTAVGRACDRHANAPTRITRAVVEPYIDGPEVDANFILQDDEILFFETSDDFPSTGDTPDVATSPELAAAPNFMETLMLLPSGLPEDEQLILRDSLKESILRQGFRSGVFHCEARVRDSRARYRPRADNGLMDLHISETTSSQASCYLHEINARPPGYLNSVSVLLAHGVDYYAIRMLLSLGDTGDRVRALSVPFSKGPQYHLGITIFPSARSGIMETPDVILEMLDKHPWMRDWIADYQTMRKAGAEVFGPGESQLWYLGYASVISRESRKECLERVRTVQDKFTYKLVGDS